MDARERMTGRVMLEWSARAVAIALSALALWRFATAPAAGTASALDRTTSATLGGALTRWSTSVSVDTLHAQLSALPSPRDRDWLAALRGAGLRVTWSGDSLGALAIDANAVTDPRGGVRVRVASPPGSRVQLGDEAGTIDTLRTARAGAELTLPSSSDTLAARTPGGVARALAPVPLVLRPVLVIGRAGWESKFVVAALEERGWHVDARFAIAPAADVTQGPAATVVDTSRYSAIVALDSAAAPSAAAIVRFVRQGGGAVIAGEATTLASLSPIAVGVAGARAAGALGAVAGQHPREGLASFPIVRPHADAIVLERRANAVSGPVMVAARRVGIGRVGQIAYDESWRWRMEGAAGALEAHRDWWSSMVASVAHASPATRDSLPHAAVASESTADAAPLAHLYDALGEPTLAPPAGAPAHLPRDTRWFLPVILLALLLEWSSRRLRGAR